MIFKEFENHSVEKKTLSTVLEFEPRSFDCIINDFASKTKDYFL